MKNIFLVIMAIFRYSVIIAMLILYFCSCNTIALGNGKGCRETENFITQMKNTGKLKKDVVYRYN